MIKSQTNPFARYLQAKKTVDDRALNTSVWNALNNRLTSNRKPLKVLEIGGGIGTMLMRMLDNELLPDSVYTLLDISHDLIDSIPHQIESWNEGHGYQIDFFDKYSFTINTPNATTAVKLVCADAIKFVDQHMEEFDLLIANAVLDLFDLETSLSRILLALTPGGLFYSTINYDGLTIFEPQINPEFETRILSLYNQSMDERQTNGQPSGDSKTGRHLFHHFKKLGLAILSAGSSDWVIFPGSKGYLHDEADFLRHLINTIENQMKGHPKIERAEFDQWVTLRKNQIDDQDLVCIVHQMDFLAAIPEA